MTQEISHTSTSPPAPTPSPSGSDARPFGRGRGGQLVAALGAGGAHVQAAVVAEAAVDVRTKWILPSGRRGKPSSATARTFRRSSCWP